MKVFEEYLNDDKKNKFFCCEVVLKYTEKTREVERLIEEINKAHDRAFDENYKTTVVVEDENTTFQTMLG